MIRARLHSALVRSAAVGLLVALALQAVPVHAIDTGKQLPPRDPPLDCTKRENNHCMECGQDEGIFACCSSAGCDIIIGPQPPPPPPAPSLGSGVIRKGLGSMTYFSR